MHQREASAKRIFLNRSTAVNRCGGAVICCYREFMKKFLTLLVTAVLSMNAFAGSFPDISLADLKSAISTKKVTLLDVNGPVTYANGHIPGALDYTAHTADLAKFLPADKNSLIVAYCGNEHCGAYARAAEAARNLGYPNVQHFKPGIAGWKASGEMTEK